MTVSVRPWGLISADLRYKLIRLDDEAARLRDEAAVAGDALAAEVARLRDEIAGMTVTESTVMLCGACGQIEPVGYDGTCCTWPMMLVSASDPRVVANEATDQLSALAAVVAAVHTALDQMERDRAKSNDPLLLLESVYACVSAIAKAVGGADVACNCGWGGTHDPDNPRCARNIAKAVGR